MKALFFCKDLQYISIETTINLFNTDFSVRDQANITNKQG